MEFSLKAFRKWPHLVALLKVRPYYLADNESKASEHEAHVINSKVLKKVYRHVCLFCQKPIIDRVGQPHTDADKVYIFVGCA